MKLDAFVMDGHEISIRAAKLDRDWMDKTDQKYAYRCLPLNIANQFGWEILCPKTFSAIWNGEKHLGAISLYSNDSAKIFPACSHFGHGILTFHISAIFRTDPGYQLMATGPINFPKDGISYLTGIIETEWAPYTFTMNVMFTHPGRVVFEKGEPFCHIFPVKADDLEAVEPKIRPLSSDPELQNQYKIWENKRNNFNNDLNKPGTEAQKQGWQKLYFKGQDVAGCPVQTVEHRTKMKLKEFSR